jgi:hypothetical protein
MGEVEDWNARGTAGSSAFLFVLLFLPPGEQPRRFTVAQSQEYVDETDLILSVALGIEGAFFHVYWSQLTVLICPFFSFFLPFQHLTHTPSTFPYHFHHASPAVARRTGPADS